MAEEKKTLNKPFRLPAGSSKKFGVYVKNDKGNVVKVTFGDPNMEIKRDDPERRKSFRARHNCENPGPKWKARYWSCWQWRAGKKVQSSDEACCKDCEDIVLAKKDKPGLWENIEKKKKRLGDDYKPAKPGDKDRPDPKSYKKAQNEKFSNEAFLLVAQDNYNSFNGPQKPTDGDKKKKKKKEKKNGY